MKTPQFYAKIIIKINSSVYAMVGGRGKNKQEVLIFRTSCLFLGYWILLNAGCFNFCAGFFQQPLQYFSRPDFQE